MPITRHRGCISMYSTNEEGDYMNKYRMYYIDDTGKKRSKQLVAIDLDDAYNLAVIWVMNYADRVVDIVPIN